jgi:hypothetical protein
VYNISEKLELAHAHYEANIMKPPSCSRPQPPLVTPTRSSHSSSRVKAMHSVAPILPSYNYYGNPIHKANECNILSEDLFCDYCGKKDIKKLFVLPSSWNESHSDYHDKISEHLLLPFNQKPRHFNLPLRLFPTKGSSSKNVKKKEHNADKKVVLQAMPLKFKLCKMNSNH